MTEKLKRSITAEDLYQLQKANDARISPDGMHVVYAVQWVDEKTEKKYSNLWIAATDGSTPPRQFTTGEQSDSTPRWSPDGSSIAFLSNRADKEKPPQIYLISINGGEARQLTRIEGEVHSFAWSPDGTRLACALRKTDAEVLEREKDEQRKKLGVVSRHYTRMFYKLDGYGYLPLERTHLWMVDTASGAATQLTDHAVYDEQFPAWSPDGQSIAFLSNRSADPDDAPDQDELYVMPAQGGAFRKIETPAGTKGHPSYSPDGKWIAYFAQEGEGLDYKNTNLWVVPADGSAPPRNLTGQYDLEANGTTLADLGEAEPIAPIWSTDGQTLFFQAIYHGSSLLESVALDGSDLKSIIAEGGVVLSFSFDREQTKLAYHYATINDPGQIFVRDRETGEDCPLTRINRDLLDQLDLGHIEEVWYKGPDGNDLQGWILKPPGFDSTKKYPSILEIHGGPMLQYGNFFMHEFYYLAAAGYVVYFTNPRGGRGYGEEHTKAIWGTEGGWGSKDYADLMAWVDYVEQLPYIDPARMGVTGGSYGGYMTVWIIGHTQRFKAAVTQRCVSNFVSMWGSSDFNWVFQHSINNRAPFEDLEAVWKVSPIAYIGNAKTPTLVIHNENDMRCPIEQGEQVYVALKRLKVETAFVRFPDEFHGLSRTGRTDRRIARLNYIKSWFDKHLSAEETIR